MGLNFYREGYEAGQASASVAAKAIKDAGTKGIAELCGKTLDERKKNEYSPWEVRYAPSWAHGFFDGYLHRAETILQIGK